MSFDGTLWGRRVQLTGITPVATATGFVGLITADNMPAEVMDGGVNSALNGGGDLRVSTDNAGANQIPLEVVNFVVSGTPSLRQAQLWVRFPTYESANRSLWLFYNRAGQTQPPVTDPFGRNSVWQDFEAAWHFSNGDDSTGNGYDLNLGSGLTQNTNSITFSGANSSSQATFTELTQATGRVRIRFNPTTTGNGIFSGRSSTTNNWFGNFNGGITYRPPDRVIGVRSLPTANVDYFAEVTNIGGTANLKVFDSSGSQVGTTITGSNPSGRITDMFGDFTANGGVRFVGDLIECHVNLNNDTQSLIDLELSNQSSPSTFWTTGTPEDTGGGSGGDTISPVGVFSAEAFGTVGVSVGGVLVSPSSVSSLEQIPQPQVVSSGVLLSPSGIPSGEVINLPTIQVGDYALLPVGIGSAELFGNPLISAGGLELLPTSISSSSSFGVPALVYAQVVQTVGIGSKEVFGLHIVSDGEALLIPLGDRETYQKLANYLRSTGRFVSEQNNDIIIEWLRSELLESGQFNDLFMEYWNRAGLTGAYNDRWKKWRS
jgi:hypothetical protein